MTLAQCAPESLSDDYLSLLGGARRFKIDGSQLALYLQGSSYMVFER
jgi:hypothetical protein